MARLVSTVEHPDATRDRLVAAPGADGIPDFVLALLMLLKLFLEGLDWPLHVWVRPVVQEVLCDI